MFNNQSLFTELQKTLQEKHDLAQEMDVLMRIMNDAESLYREKAKQINSINAKTKDIQNEFNKSLVSSKSDWEIQAKLKAEINSHSKKTNAEEQQAA